MYIYIYIYSSQVQGLLGSCSDNYKGTCFINKIIHVIISPALLRFKHSVCLEPRFKIYEQGIRTNLLLYRILKQ